MRLQKKLFLWGALALASSAAVFVATSGRRIHIRRGAAVISVAVKNGDTLSAILSPRGFSGQDVMDIARLLRKENIKSLKAGQDVIKISDGRAVILSGPWKQIDCAKTGVWRCLASDIEKEISVVQKSGEIKDGDSFYAAGVRAGIPESVLADAYDLLAFEMDFERDMRAGQLFSIVYETHYSEGVFAGVGNIIALSFDAGRRGVIKMYRFGRGYYDEHGGGAIKSLKRTPINNARVSSSFGNRRHPVLGYSRAHRGVDFRAGTGTPIPSAGAGRVVSRGTNDGYGNFIRIRHNATYETLYAHMSRFQPGVGNGSVVRQGQIVGYVGSTGLSTGPHLHYEIIKNGQRVNPMTVKLPAINDLPQADMADFLDLREGLDRAMDILRRFPDLFIKE